MGNLVKGDLGKSFQFKNANVTELIINRIGPSVILGAQGIILGVLSVLY